MTHTMSMSKEIKQACDDVSVHIYHSQWLRHGNNSSLLIEGIKKTGPRYTVKCYLAVRGKLSLVTAWGTKKQHKERIYFGFQFEGTWQAHCGGRKMLWLITWFNIRKQSEMKAGVQILSFLSSWDPSLWEPDTYIQGDGNTVRDIPRVMFP